MKAPILPAGLDEVTRWYRVPEREKVEDFLGAHPEIVPVLLEARPYLEKQFGPKAVVELRIPFDYETGTRDDLFAYALTRIDPDEATDRMDRFWDDWWGAAKDEHPDLPLNFDVDYDVNGQTQE